MNRSLNNSIKFTNSIGKKLNSTIKNQTVIRPWDVWEYCLLILLIFALIGNTLTILIMRSKKMRTTNTALFLTFMAFADMFVLALKFTVNMQKLYQIPVYEICILIQILPDIAALSSYWLIIITTLERCIAVWYPLKIAQIMTRRRCILLIFILICLLTLLSSTQIVCLKSLPLTPHFCGIKGSITGSCRIYLKNVYPWIKSVLMSWLPGVLGIILNLLIIISLAKASKQRENIAIRMPTYKQRNSEVEILQENNGQFKKVHFKSVKMQISKERQITIMLCTVSITFVLFTFPYAVFELLRKLNPTVPAFKSRFTHRAVLFILDCLHSTNFILYCLTGKKFRDELKNILRCRLK